MRALRLGVDFLMANYEQARSDFEYLESLSELEDQVELDARRLDLMQNPTKAMAAKMYAAGCRLWMHEHWNDFVQHQRVRDIEDRYG